MRPLIAGISLAIAVLFASSLSALADERILSFASDVTINEDASILVIETIKVRAEGNQIRRGIFRTFPTNYKDKKGIKYRVGFEVLDVERDGRSEPYKVNNISGGKAIRIGDADIFLESGVHTYKIRYRATRLLGFFEGFDELYWNVTGNEWDFPIDEARVTINLPRNASPLEMSGYTGRYGEAEASYEVTQSVEGLVRASTTRILGPREGFSLAVSWPTGSVTRPTKADKAQNFAADNLSLAIALLGFLGVLAFYTTIWNKHGRDPEPGAIIPRFKPPLGFSPAACRFVWKMGYDRKAFSAALINMAVKGFIKIEETGKTFKIIKVGHYAGSLSSGEKRIASRLIGTQSSIELEQSNHAQIGGAVNAFNESLEGEYEVKYFKTNRRYFVFGAILSAICLIATIFTARNASPETLFMGIWISFWTVGAAFLIFRVLRGWQAVNLGLGSHVKNVVRAVALSLLAIPFAGGEIFAISRLSIDTTVITAIAIFGLFATNVAFYFLLKAPTLLGRKILDEIEGFLMYLSTAEQHRLDALHPPEKTPELFEKFLPYALALDVETKWTENFTDVLARAAEAGQEYQPAWYTGRNWHSGNPAAFASSIGNSVASAVATSASPPGSSSGSGGGGFSGGGGGGGGGGGW
jgi:uncharacterized membrane protein YgcG